MVYLYEPFGGLSNNLFQHIHLDAFCRENNIPFVNHFIGKYAETDLPVSAAFKFRKLLTGLHLAKLVEFNSEEDNKKDALLKKYSPVFVRGWAYRNKPLTIRERAYYNKFFFGNFKPKEDPFEKGFPNIAVHIRRGDYLNWQNGIYFYKDEVYINAIQRLISFLTKNSKVLIFTNDAALDRKLYSIQFPNIYFSKNNEKTDHYLMSRCDYIIGPPSSFSMWGSYIGNTKFYHLKTPNDNFFLRDFTVCEG